MLRGKSEKCDLFAGVELDPSVPHRDLLVGSQCLNCALINSLNKHHGLCKKVSLSLSLCVSRTCGDRINADGVS